MVESFNLISSNSPKIMILGSAPSVISLDLYEYYGNNRNSFWPIIAKIYNKKKFKSYNEKINFIKDNNLLLWDVVQTCSRKGSLDSSIQNVEVNDIKSLLDNNESLKAIMFNGKTAYNLYKKYINYFSKNIDFNILPSTSPAYTISFNDKYCLWKKVFDKYK